MRKNITYTNIGIIFILVLSLSIFVLGENVFKSEREKVTSAKVLKPSEINTNLNGLYVLEIPMKHISPVKFEIPVCSNDDCSEFRREISKTGLAYASVTLERNENDEWKKRIVDGKWGNLTVGGVSIDINKASSDIKKIKTEVVNNVYLQNPESLSGNSGGEMRAYGEYIEIEDRNIIIIGTIYNSEVKNDELFLISDQSLESVISSINNDIPQNKVFTRLFLAGSFLLTAFYIGFKYRKNIK